MPPRRRRARAAALALLAWPPRVVGGEPLLLTPLVRAGRLAAARELSRVSVDGHAMGHSGFLSVPSASGRRTNHLFTWFQPCLEGCDAAAAPLIQYFNGGPGSPDTVGAMNQIGNWYVDGALALHERCFAWCKRNNCLFVDSPVMTGFSYQTDLAGRFDAGQVEYTRSSRDATEQVLGALLQFFEIWPEYRPAPYYVHGLSYGGRYVPEMARAVLRHNSVSSSRINLQGIAAGDPVMDNKAQFPTQATTLFSLGLLMEDERAIVESIMANATALNDVNCTQAFSEWNRVFNDDGGSSCAPNCDFLFKAFTGSENTEHLLLGAQPQNLGYFRGFLKEHLSEFHVDGQPHNSSFEEGGSVYSAMVHSGDFCEPSAPLYTSLFLEAGIDVLVYSSNLDPLLGPPTTAAGVQSAWDHAEATVPGGAEAKSRYYAQKKQIWRVAASDTNPAGYARCLARRGRRFCNVVVRNAGHETASYAPRAAHDLNERFLHSRPFGGWFSAATPQCQECGGAPPLAGAALPACGGAGRVAGGEELEVLYQ